MAAEDRYNGSGNADNPYNTYNAASQPAPAATYNGGTSVRGELPWPLVERLVRDHQRGRRALSR